jgi:hypothetical protein
MLVLLCAAEIADLRRIGSFRSGGQFRRGHA